MTDTNLSSGDIERDGPDHFIRGIIKDMVGAEAADAVRIQYGGSMKPDNAAELLGQPDIDGGLIGGAALDAVSFAAIVKAAM